MKGRNLLMIPGPIEVEPEVMQVMGSPTTSHVDPNFIESFGQALEGIRQVFLAPSSQPFIVAGSGTLAMDMAAANLIEPGDRALVISTGYFGARYADILSRYGGEIDVLTAPIGGRVPLEEIEGALREKSYKLTTLTQVDTSTGVSMEVAAVAELTDSHETLLVVDGVCSVGGEELRQDEWGVDLTLTASQKAISIPPGLALLMVGPRAMEAWNTRTQPVLNYYADFGNWLPIMEAYEARQASYFATPAVNLVAALSRSLKLILQEGLEARFSRHHALGSAMQAALQALELDQVPIDPQYAANTLTAPRFPEGVDGKAFLADMKAEGVIVAGGLHPDIKSQYFRIGHMGPTSTGDLLQTLAAVEICLHQQGYPLQLGTGLAAAQREFAGR